jgi:transposase
MFEAFATGVLQSAANIKRAAELLRLPWKSTQQIMQDAVERGLERRTEQPVAHVGIDENRFGSGHDYMHRS